MIAILVLAALLSLGGVIVAIVVARRTSRSRRFPRPMKVAGLTAAAIGGLLSLGLGVTTTHEAYNRLTLVSEEIVVTVTESWTGTRILTKSTPVGKMIATTGDLQPFTGFRTEEFPDFSFEAPGHHDWSPGQKVRLRIFRRDGEIVSYDYLAE